MTCPPNFSLSLVILKGINVRYFCIFYKHYSPFYFIDISDWWSADHGGSSVEGTNCLCSFEWWDRGFESHSRHECLCMRLICLCVILCVGSGLATRWSPSRESYLLHKYVYENEESSRAQQWVIDPLMNEWLNDRWSRNICLQMHYDLTLVRK
jgi:hypothetical protein